MADNAPEGKDTLSTPTAGVIIIGDEILKSHTKDANSYFLLRRLWSLGVKVGRVSVIPDDVHSIAHEVRQLSGQFSFVITTGGLGPTHDDVTMAGIAKAFGEDLVHNHEIETLIRELYNEEINAAHLKMAQVPRSAELVYGVDETRKEKSQFPIVVVRNVYVFPGVPRLLEKYFGMFECVLVPDKKRFFLHKVFLSVEETEVASILEETDRLFRQSVHLGSYPNFEGTEFKVKVALESESRDTLSEAWAFLHSKLPKGSILKSEGDCDSANDLHGKYPWVWTVNYHHHNPTPAHISLPPSLPSKKGKKGGRGGGRQVGRGGKENSYFPAFPFSPHPLCRCFSSHPQFSMVAEDGSI